MEFRLPGFNAHLQHTQVYSMPSSHYTNYSNAMEGAPVDLQRQAIQRELEKEMIREKIIAEEVERFRVLQAKTRRDLMIQRETMAVKSGDGFPSSFMLRPQSGEINEITASYPKFGAPSFLPNPRFQSPFLVPLPLGVCVGLCTPSCFLRSGAIIVTRRPLERRCCRRGAGARKSCLKDDVDEDVGKALDGFWIIVLDQTVLFLSHRLLFHPPPLIPFVRSPVNSRPLFVVLSSLPFVLLCMRFSCSFGEFSCPAKSTAKIEFLLELHGCWIFLRCRTSLTIAVEFPSFPYFLDLLSLGAPFRFSSVLSFFSVSRLFMVSVGCDADQTRRNRPSIAGRRQLPPVEQMLLCSPSPSSYSGFFGIYDHETSVQWVMKEYPISIDFLEVFLRDFMTASTKKKTNNYLISEG
ncbi:hypothetical protein L1887_02959 [Cichorium endivia]|nr:hypothetical protein L1887_02959 [Cichorium endivia]